MKRRAESGSGRMRAAGKGEKAQSSTKQFRDPRARWPSRSITAATGGPEKKRPGSGARKTEATQDGTKQNE